MKIYHNPRCSKSRDTLQLIIQKGIKPEIVEYLKKPITEIELKNISMLLGLKPIELIRKKEAVFIEKYKGKNFTDEEWIGIILKHPMLLERPIVITQGKAIIGRPPEKVLEIL